MRALIAGLGLASMLATGTAAAQLAPFNEVGVTVLIASHDVELLKRMNKRILGLVEGKLVHDGVLW